MKTVITALSLLVLVILSASSQDMPEVLEFQREFQEIMDSLSVELQDEFRVLRIITGAALWWGITVLIFILIGIAQLAKRFQRNQAVWVILGIIFTPIPAILVLLCFGKNTEPTVMHAGTGSV